jgi:cell division protein FtsZ
MSRAERIIQMGVTATEGLGAGSQPDVGRAAAEEVIDEIRDQLTGAHMVFVTAGMGGGTGTGASPVVARVARELGILTVGVVTKPFHFEGRRRMWLAEFGIMELQKTVDTQIIIPNQNLFRVANEKTTFADAFAMADQVLYSGVACITDLMVKEGLINLDFADVRAVMREMGSAMMGTGEASGEKRALRSAEEAISNPLMDELSLRGARGALISITGGKDLTLYEVDEAATRIREEVDADANIIVGAAFDDSRGDDGHTTPDQVSHQGRQAIVLTLQPVVLHCHVLAIDVAIFAKALAEGRHIARGGNGRSAVDEPDHGNPRLLSARGERPGGCDAPETRDKFAPPHHLPSAESTAYRGRGCVSGFDYIHFAAREAADGPFRKLSAGRRVAASGSTPDADRT